MPAPEDTVYLLRMPHQHEPNMDIVRPSLDVDGNLMGWKSIITGLSLPAMHDKEWEGDEDAGDEVIPLPETGWTKAGEIFK